MYIAQYPRSRKLGFNMTPMIDVVFLLIIFFLVSSHLARQETQLELPLPVAKSGEDDTDVQTPRVTVNVKQDGTLLVAGRTVTPAQLGRQLTDAIDSQGGDVEVRIRTNRQTPYGKVEPVMLACTRSGIWNVTYAVYRDEVSGQ